MAPRRKTFAGILELIGERYSSLPTDIDWPLAKVPKEGAQTLVVDGYNSTSLNHITQDYSEKALQLPVAAFSYYAIGKHYLSFHTQQPIETSAQLLAMYLHESGTSIYKVHLRGVLGRTLNLRRKLGVKSRIKAVAVARKHGLL